MRAVEEVTPPLMSMCFFDLSRARERTFLKALKSAVTEIRPSLATLVVRA